MDNSIKRKALSFILAIALSLLFTLIEYKGDSGVGQFYVPIVFASVFSLSFFYPKIRKVFIILSSSLLVIMVFFYLFNKLDLSDWFGSLGFGILILVISTYLPILIKQGQLDKF